MDSTKYLTFFNQYNDDLDKKIIRLALIYLPNEAILVDIKGNVIHYLNSGPKKVDILSKKTIIGFAYALSFENTEWDYHILALTEYEIYGIGRNTYRQVQFESSLHQKTWVKLPITKSFSEKYLSIACVYGHSIALTSNNNVILWGKNDEGQIGNGTSSKTNIERPFKLKFRQDKFSNKFSTENTKKRIVIEDGRVVEIACSSSNSFALCDNGKVYGWGLNTIGQLGSVLDNNFLKPNVIFGNIKQIVSFYSHTLVLRNDGVLFGMGNNSSGQVGKRTRNSYYANPIRFETKFKRIATWENLSMGESIDGKFYIMGDYGKVDFSCITIRRKVSKVKYIDRGIQVNMDREAKSKKTKKYNRKKPPKNLGPHRAPPPSYSDIDQPSSSTQNDQTQKSDSDSSFGSSSSDEELKINEDKHEKSELSDSVDSDDSDDSSADEEKKQGKKKSKGKKNKEKEKQELLKALENSKIELLSYHLELFNLTEVKCKSLEEIVARHFNVSYFNLKNSTANPAEFNKEYNDKELIDLSNMIVFKIEEYEEVVELKPVPAASKSDKNDQEKMKAMEKRINELELKKTEGTTIHKYHFGDRSKMSVFDKTTLSEIKGFNVSDIGQTGRANR